jgi:hypothetical protein
MPKAPVKKLKRKKSTGQTTAVAKVPQPHGGALNAGGTPGNPGGGRPKDEVREKLLKIANGQGVDFLADLMEGKIVTALVGECPDCKAQHPFDPNIGKILLDSVRASADQRLKGLDLSLKYGAGTKDETTLTTDQVRALCLAYSEKVLQIVAEEAPGSMNAIQARVDQALAMVAA